MSTEDLAEPRLARASADQLLERHTGLTELGGILVGPEQGRGRVAVIEGPAGIGKTALLSRAQTRARELGVTVLSARGGGLEGLRATILLTTRTGERGTSDDLIRVLEAEVAPIAIRPAPLTGGRRWSTPCGALRRAA